MKFAALVALYSSIDSSCILYTTLSMQRQIVGIKDAIQIHMQKLLVSS
jgi:hypothetical protein